MRRRYSLKTIKIEEMSTEVEIRQGCFDFIAHYPLEECVWRLYAQHEKADPFAWRGEIRTDVKVDESDHSVSRFEVCRVKKRSNTTAEAAVIIKGELEALDKQQTQVRGTIEILLIWLILPTLLIRTYSNPWESITTSIVAMIMTQKSILVAISI